MTQLLAHRGASHLAPENTLSAFQLGRELGADGFECDVQRCQSGELVLFHDEKVDRTSNFQDLKVQNQILSSSNKIKDLSYKDLQKLDVGNWKNEKFKGEKIPLLEEIFKFLSPEEFLIIEVKIRQIFSNGAEHELFDLLEKFSIQDQVLVASFNPFFLWRFKRITQKYRIGLISDVKPSHVRQRKIWQRILKPFALLLEDYSGSEVEIIQAHQNHRKVFLWTLDSIEEIQGAFQKGADGVISNRAEIFKDFRKE